MPIYFNQENGSWEARDLTQAEQESLIEAAKDFIIDGLGAELASNIMRVAQQQNLLGNMPKDEMGHA